MRSSSISSFISSIIILYVVFNSTVRSATNPARSDSLIEKACSNPRLSSKTNSCVQVLGTQRDIVSATNFHDLSIAIMHSGISNATIARNYVENLFKGPNLPPNSRGALQDCRYSFHSVMLTFNSALTEVNAKDYNTATYDLLVGSTDNIQRCMDNVASGRIKDSGIANAIQVVPLYGLSAYQAIETL